MKRKNLTKILVADRGCDVLLTALSQDQDAELQYSRLASQALSMPPGHLSPQLQGLTQWSPSLSPALPKAWTRCLGGPAADGCHQGMTCPFSRAPPPKDQEVEVWGREGGPPPRWGYNFHNVIRIQGQSLSCTRSKQRKVQSKWCEVGEFGELNHGRLHVGSPHLP